MAENKTLTGMPLMLAGDPGLLRKLGLLAGLALSISIGVTAAFWMKEPGYTLLYSQIGDREAGEVARHLAVSGIPYRLDRQTGAIMVPPSRIHDARLTLAAEGLPRSAGFGLEIIENESGLASSQFMENARYHHALETELARTITTLQPVQSARVHLAIPRSSVFLRQSARPSASVLLQLYSGRSLSNDQVSSIVHLVASSIPEMESERVTVVDQQGRLLNSPDGGGSAAFSNRQFEQVRRLEETYIQRIESLLAPMLGPNRVRAMVTAELDFTVREETREQFDPAGTVIRSEQVSEDRRRSGQNPGGIPGALANLPAAEGGEPAGGPALPGDDLNESVRRTRNFEVDRTLSHARNAPGTLRRLSAAILIDERQVIEPDGTLRSERLSPAELAEVQQLVRDAIGFDEARGDSISVSNVAFFAAPEPEAGMAGAGFLADPTTREMARQLFSAVVLIAVALLLVRPLLTALSGAFGSGAGSPQAVLPTGSGPSPAMVPASPGPVVLSYEDKVGVARQLADSNPERVAQIVSSWMQSDD
ncbi:MAG: flagellar M-ring protein FliF [Chromatiales bacterium]|nr:flagellar M-ring protein FliF [Chromatiales bacterium]